MQRIGKLRPSSEMGRVRIDNLRRPNSKRVNYRSALLNSPLSMRAYKTNSSH